MSMGTTMMNSVLSSGTTLQKIKSIDSQRRLMDSRTGIMETEIKTDKERNVNTKKKEEELAAAEEKINTMTRQIGSELKDLQDKIAEDNEKIREEEKIKDKKEQKDKAEKKDKENWELPRDTVEISREARTAAAKNPSGSSSAGSATAVTTPAASASDSVKAVSNVDVQV